MSLFVRFVLIFLVAQVSTISYAGNFKYKKIKRFKKLSSFKSVKLFERSLKRYEKKCFDATTSLRCFVKGSLWDRELNIYYRKLRSVLNPTEKKALKKSQRNWLKGRNLSLKFNIMMLQKKYRGPGSRSVKATMMRDGVSRLVAPMIKSRALLLKEWYKEYN